MSIQEMSLDYSRLTGDNRPKAVLGEKNGKLILDPHRVRRFERQPRTYFNRAKLVEIKLSISQAGQTDPIKVKIITGDPDFDFELIDGERRCRACIELNLPVFAIIEEVTSLLDQFVKSFVANNQREGHESLDIAHALDFMITEGGMSVKEAAEKSGKSMAWVYDHLSLLKLPPAVQKMMDPSLPKEEQLGMRVALDILKLPRAIQETTAENIVKHRMKTGQGRRHVEEIAKRMNISIRSPRRSPREDYKNLSRSAGSLADEMRPFSSRQPLSLYALFKDRSDPIGDLDRMLQTIKEGHDQIKILYAKLGSLRPDLERFAAGKNRK